MWRKLVPGVLVGLLVGPSSQSDGFVTNWWLRIDDDRGTRQAELSREVFGCRLCEEVSFRSPASTTVACESGKGFIHGGAQ